MAKAPDAKHMLWKVTSDEGVEGYLVGSIHVMKRASYPLDSLFAQTFENSDAVVFELNFDSAEARTPRLIRELGTFTGTRTLHDALSPSTDSLLGRTYEDLSLSGERFERLEPWVVALTIPNLEMAATGYDGRNAVDRHFFERAKNAGKAVIGLESAAEQLRLFDSLPAGLQEKFLRHSLEKADHRLEHVAKMVDAWTRGDTDGLRRLVLDDWEDEFPVLYDRLIVQRNDRWIPKIEEVFAERGPTMMVVGAAHMLGGDGSLVTKLEERGYDVEQL